MGMIKYTIAGGVTEGLLDAASVINVTPGDRKGTSYIKVAGMAGIKAGNEVDTICDRINKSLEADRVAANPLTAEHITFKQLLMNRQLALSSKKDAASVAKLEEIGLLLTLV